MKNFFALLCIVVALNATAQPDRWQQAVDYKMDIQMDVSKHQFTRIQTLKNTNNSQDTL